MKTKILLVISAVLLTSCEKENIPIYYPGEMELGKMTAKKEGKDWIASGAARRHYNDPNSAFFCVGADTYSEEGFWRESLSFCEIPFEVGKYKVSGLTTDMGDGFVGSSYGTLQDDGDVAEDYYKVYEMACDNYIEITYLDTVANLVKGNFTVTYEVTTEHTVNPNNPKKVKFSDGLFEVEFY